MGLVLPPQKETRKAVLDALLESEDVSKEELDAFNWGYVSKMKLSPAFVHRFYKQLNMVDVLEQVNFTERDLREFDFEDDRCWLVISRRFELSEDYLHEHFEQVSMSVVLKHHQLSEAFLASHLPRLYRMDVIQHQKLSENFIENILIPNSRMEWYAITTDQLLSESFIVKHWDKLWHEWIFIKQPISSEFIEVNYDRFSPKDLKAIYHHVHCLNPRIKRKIARVLGL